MTDSASRPWRPTTFLRFEQAYDTSMGTARIVTDAGPAFIKAMGNPEGPHHLACELVGTQLARWLGLPTFEYAVMSLDDKVDEIPFKKGGRAASGPAFVTRVAKGHPWDGSEAGLDGLLNPEDISRLVVFDTWIRNCDRHAPHLSGRRPHYDNVFIEDAGDREFGGFRLIAMDHTHCFTSTGELNPNLANIQLVKDSALYGLFPGFVPWVRQAAVETAIARLGQLEEDAVAEVIAAVPPEWEVDGRTRQAWQEMICRRASFVRETIMAPIKKVCWPDQFWDTQA